MPAYAIFILNKMLDPAEMNTYTPMSKASLQDFSPKVLAFGGAMEVLEGDAAQGVVIFQFETLAKAKAWYDSPAYQEAKQHRLRGGDFRVIFTEGLAA